MNPIHHIALIGPMGAGKSTIGRRLAEHLDIPFVDSDREIELRTGADIPLIFELEGEEGFRQREQALLAELCARHEPMVLSTGGGAILAEANRQLLQAWGHVIWLQVSLEEQLQRTSRDTNRPLLHTDDPRTRLMQLAELRNPLYAACADVQVSTDRRDSGRVVQEILDHLPLA